MGNKEWDNYLRDLLGDFKTEGEPSHWAEFAQQLDATPDPSDFPEQAQDELLKEKLSNYTPQGQVEGWDRIEASLDTAEKEFDLQVRSRLNNFQPPKDPHSWPAFQQYFAAHKLLRTKLIALKVFETAAMVLFLVTILHMGQLGKFPFLTSPTEDLVQHETGNISTIGASIPETLESNANESLAATSKQPASLPSPKSSSNPGVILTATSSDAVVPVAKETTPVLLANIEPLQSRSSFPAILQEDLANTVPAILSMDEVESMSNLAQIELSSEGYPAQANDQLVTIPSPERENYSTKSLPLQKSNFKYTQANKVPDPVFVKVAEKTFLEFGMLAQVDYNQLKLPEDRLYNNGKQEIFPLQGLTSPGYGAGFTLAIAHSRWALETGVIYNAKSFRPGRELTIGGTADNSNVEFDAMRMQLVSVPLQYRYRFVPNGRLKAYALAGFGLHLIAQSDIDVLVEYNFPSLPEGENPNNNPSLARTIRETKRVSENFREKAPFSSESFISANLGLGLEYILTERKTLFLQTAYQYQIPNLRFSNHNGKHLLTVSVQAGIRTPLGA